MPAFAETPCCAGGGGQSPRSCGSTAAGGSGGSTASPTSPTSPPPSPLGPRGGPRPPALEVRLHLPDLPEVAAPLPPITKLNVWVAQEICYYLDAKSLAQAEQAWPFMLSASNQGLLWRRRLVEDFSVRVMEAVEERAGDEDGQQGADASAMAWRRRYAALRDAEGGRTAASRPVQQDVPADDDVLFRKLCNVKLVSKQVQNLLVNGQRQDAMAVLRCLGGRICQAVASRFGNYVVCSFIDNWGNDEEIVGLILEELWEGRLYWAKHEYCVRTVCKLLKMSVTGRAAGEFLDGILEYPWALVGEHFGHQVLDHALRYGMAHQKSRIIRALFADGAAFQYWAGGSPDTCSPYACFLLEAAVEGLAEDPAALQQERQLIVQAVGSFTVEAFLWLCWQHSGTKTDKPFIMLKAAAELPEIDAHLRLPSSKAVLLACPHGKRFLKYMSTRA